MYLSLPNQKGGVGKTTLSLHLAWRCQELGLRVLAVDLDPQGNFSESLLGVDTLDMVEVEDNTLYEKLDQQQQEGVYCRRSYHLLNSELPAPLKPVPTKYPGLDVLPSLITDGSLQAVNKQPVDDAVYPKMHLKTIDHDYDVVVIDVPPQKDTLQLAGVIASNKIVLPVMMSAYPIRGVRAMMDTIKELKAIGIKVDLVGVLVNIYSSSSKDHKEGVTMLEARLGALLLKNKIGYRTSMDTSIGNMQPVWKVSSGAAREAGKKVRGAMDEILIKAGFESEVKAFLSKESKQRDARMKSRKKAAPTSRAKARKPSTKAQASIGDKS
jgi:chromosome partitioning protein